MSHLVFLAKTALTGVRLCVNLYKNSSITAAIHTKEFPRVLMIVKM